MEKTISATEARVRFGELLHQVADEQQVIVVERGGKPQAVVLSLEQYERLKSQAVTRDWQARLAKANELRTKIAARRGGVSLSPAEEIIRQGREARDESFNRLR